MRPTFTWPRAARWTPRTCTPRPACPAESLYVGMTRGRLANTAHVVTGPARGQGSADWPRPTPEAVLAEILDRTESAWTATEVMREAQGFATNSGHLLAMYAAATRARCTRPLTRR